MHLMTCMSKCSVIQALIARRRTGYMNRQGWQGLLSNITIRQALQIHVGLLVGNRMSHSVSWADSMLPYKLRWLGVCKTALGEDVEQTASYYPPPFIETLQLMPVCAKAKSYYILPAVVYVAIIAQT